MQKVLYATLGLIALLILVGLALPRTMIVEVDAEIDARPATVHALLNDFRRVRQWTTRYTADPNARIAYGGPTRGVDASVSWDGPVIGSGTERIVQSEPFATVTTVLNPGEPGEARSHFKIIPEGALTRLEWTFEADHGFNLMARFVSLFVDDMLARELGDSVQNLKALAESLPRADFSRLEIEWLIVEAEEIAYLRTRSSREAAAISVAMANAYFEVLSFIDAHNLVEAGAPIAITRPFSGAERVFDAAIPVDGLTGETPRDGATVTIGKTYAGPVVRASHNGSYRRLAETHRKVAAYMAALGLERNGDAWEAYVNDPARVAEADLLTYVYYPVREPR